MIDTASARLHFLLETVELESRHLQDTDRRLFEQPFTEVRALALRADDLLAERVDAFAARFARLQDTAGDKLLPVLLERLGEPVGSVLDNLDRAARLGLLVQTSDEWIAARALRNRMVHEYIRDAAALAQALTEAHRAVPMLAAFALACRSYADSRGLISKAQKP
jgi:hypothetical protein